LLGAYPFFQRPATVRRSTVSSQDWATASCRLPGRVDQFIGDGVMALFGIDGSPRAGVPGRAAAKLSPRHR